MCIAENENGASGIVFTLNVLCEFSMLIDLLRVHLLKSFYLSDIVAPMPETNSVGMIQVIRNRSVTMNCSMSANPPPTYEWFKDK